MWMLIALLALSLVLTYNEAVAAGSKAPFFGLSLGLLVDGGLCYFILKRKAAARIILGILLLLPAALTFSLHFSARESVPGLVLVRHAIIAAFALALLFWRPVRSYTRKPSIA